MNTPSNTASESSLASEAIAPAAVSPTRPMYWSVRRELWENRSIYVAPLSVAAVALFGFLVSTIHLPQSMRATLTLDAAHQYVEITKPYNFVAFLILATAFLVGVFYSLDALHGERRDRSILFWKSLPVSDLTAVLSKACIPLIVLPVLTFAIIVATQFIMLLLSTAVLLANGLSAATLWRQVNFGELSIALLFGLVAIALWHAPFYCWLLLVSAWARRATILWIILPPLAIGVFERIAFHTTHVASLLGYRMIGWFTLVFQVRPGSVPSHPLSTLTPGRFLAAPGLWLGLAFAAIFLALAARLRRNRGPI